VLLTFIRRHCVLLLLSFLGLGARVSVALLCQISEPLAFDMMKDNFLLNDNLNVYSFGVPPVSIDILLNVKGLTFDEAFSHAIEAVWDKIPAKVLDLPDLIIAKQAAGQHKDLDDVVNIGKS